MKDHYENIEAYLAGQLKDQDLTNFEKELAENEAFAREVKIIQQLQNTMGSKEQDILSFQEKALEIYRDQNHSNNKKPSSHPPSSPLFRVFTILLVVMLLVWLVLSNINSSPSEHIKNQPDKDSKTTPTEFNKIITKETPQTPIADKDTHIPIIDINSDGYPDLIQNNKTKDDGNMTIKQESSSNKTTIDKINPYLALAKTTYQPLEYTSLRSEVKEGSTKTKSALQNAQFAYSNGNIQEAVNILNDSTPENQKTEWLKLRAHSYFQVGEFSKSSADFKAIIHSPSYGNDAKWFYLLALAARLPQQKDAFDLHLENFKNNNGGYLTRIQGFETKLKSIKN